MVGAVTTSTVTTNSQKLRLCSTTIMSTLQRDDDQSERESSSSEGGQTTSGLQCLFCDRVFACGNEEDGLVFNLEHMQTAHSLSIPESEEVTDMLSFLDYLAIEIRTWHECIYCGATKRSTRSVQSHMRDKDHCRLNLEREPELLEFWECPDRLGNDNGAVTGQDERSIRLSSTEIRLASGRIVSSANTVSVARRLARQHHRPSQISQALIPKVEEQERAPLPPPLQPEAGQGAAPVPRTEPQLRPGRQIARREEMGLLGLATQQRKALVLAEKKAQRSEDVARRAREWAYAKGANSQKYDQVDTTAKKGKQNHKLQPR